MNLEGRHYKGKNPTAGSSRKIVFRLATSVKKISSPLRQFWVLGSEDLNLCVREIAPRG